MTLLLNSFPQCQIYEVISELFVFGLGDTADSVIDCFQEINPAEPLATECDGEVSDVAPSYCIGTYSQSQRRLNALSIGKSDWSEVFIVASI